MASCATPQFGSGTCPQFQLTVTTSGGSASNNTCTVSWYLDFVAHGYAWNSASAKSWSVTIDGAVRGSGSFNINGITGTSRVSNGSFTANRGTGGAARTISFSVTVNFNSAAWSGVAGGTKTGSGSVATPAITQQFTVSYNANGGTGAPSNQTKVYGTTLKLSTTEPTRTGYLFQGWGTSASATTPTYSPGDNYTANAAITLYAVWSLANLIKLTVTPKTITIPSTSDGHGDPKATTLAFVPVSDDTNKDLDFYYRICYVDDSAGNVSDPKTNSLGKIYGPFTATDISAGNGGTNSTTIPVPADLILNSLINGKNETKIKFLVQCCTTANSFKSDLTTSTIVTCTLSNFNFLWIKIVSCFRTSSGGLKAIVQVKFPKSYTAMTSYRPPTIRIDGAEGALTPTNSATKGTDNLITYTLELTSSQINSSSHNLEFEISDGIIDAIGYSRIGSVGGEDIYIYKGTNACKCTEFIEGDGPKFQKGGRVYADEFIETDGGVIIGNTMYFGELIEE